MLNDIGSIKKKYSVLKFRDHLVYLYLFNNIYHSLEIFAIDEVGNSLNSVIVLIDFKLAQWIFIQRRLCWHKAKLGSSDVGGG